MADEFDDILNLYKEPKKKPVKSPYDDLIEESATRHGVDPDLIRAMARQESSFKPNAVSSKNAQGLMQLIPETAARFGVTDVFDPKQNIEGGTKYMRWLLDRYDGDVDLALAGYNAGEGAVDKYGKKIPPYRETQDYVKKIRANYKGAGRLAKAFNSLDEVIGAYGGAAQKPLDVNAPDNFDSIAAGYQTPQTPLSQPTNAVPTPQIDPRTEIEKEINGLKLNNSALNPVSIEYKLNEQKILALSDELAKLPTPPVTPTVKPSPTFPVQTVQKPQTTPPAGLTEEEGLPKPRPKSTFKDDAGNEYEESDDREGLGENQMRLVQIPRVGQKTGTTAPVIVEKQADGKFKPVPVPTSTPQDKKRARRQRLMPRRAEESTDVQITPPTTFTPVGREQERTSRMAQDNFAEINRTFDYQGEKTPERQFEAVRREFDTAVLEAIPNATQADIDAVGSPIERQDAGEIKSRFSIRVDPSFLKSVAAERDKRLWVERKQREAKELADKISIPLEEAEFQVGLRDAANIEKVRAGRAREAEAEKAYSDRWLPIILEGYKANPGGVEDIQAEAEKDIRRQIADIKAEYGTLENYYREKREMWKRIAENPNTAALEFTKNLTRSLPKAASAVFKTISIGSELIERPEVSGFFGRLIADPREAKERGFYKLGEWIDRQTDEFLPQDPQLRKSFILTTLPDTLGQLAVQIGAGALTGGIAAPLIIGGASGAASQYEEADRLGATRGQKLLSAVTGGIAAIPDAIPLAKWLKPLTNVERAGFMTRFLTSMFGKAAEEAGEREAKATLKEFLKNAWKGGLFEGTQELSENKINDFVASLTYDKKRKVLTINGNDIESFIAGFIGGVAGGSFETVAESSGGKDFENKIVFEAEQKLAAMPEESAPEENASAEAETPAQKPQVTPAGKMPSTFDDVAELYKDEKQTPSEQIPSPVDAGANVPPAVAQSENVSPTEKPRIWQPVKVQGIQLSPRENTNVEENSTPVETSQISQNLPVSENNESKTVDSTQSALAAALGDDAALIDIVRDVAANQNTDATKIAAIKDVLMTDQAKAEKVFQALQSENKPTISEIAEESPNIHIVKPGAAQTQERPAKLPDNISETWDAKYLNPPSETTTGRKVTPLPKIDAETRKKGVNTEKRMDAWLVQNALAEANSRGDSFNARTFNSQIDKKLSPADREAAYSYLFDESWKDVGGGSRPSVLKPVAPETKTDNAPAKSMTDIFREQLAKRRAAEEAKKAEAEQANRNADAAELTKGDWFEMAGTNYQVVGDADDMISIKAENSTTTDRAFDKVMTRRSLAESGAKKIKPPKEKPAEPAKSEEKPFTPREGWTRDLMKAREYANHLGIEWKGKNLQLAELLELIHQKNARETEEKATENKPAPKRSQVAQPTVIKRGIKFTTARGENLTGTQYLVPGLEELDLVVTEPRGSRSKSTKTGWEVYELNSGIEVDHSRSVGTRDDMIEPLAVIFKRIQNNIKDVEAFKKKVAEIVAAKDAPKEEKDRFTVAQQEHINRHLADGVLQLIHITESGGAILEISTNSGIRRHLHVDRDGKVYGSPSSNPTPQSIKAEKEKIASFGENVKAIKPDEYRAEYQKTATEQPKAEKEKPLSEPVYTTANGYKVFKTPFGDYQVKTPLGAATGNRERSLEIAKQIADAMDESAQRVTKAGKLEKPKDLAKAGRFDEFGYFDPSFREPEQLESFRDYYQQLANTTRDAFERQQAAEAVKAINRTLLIRKGLASLTPKQESADTVSVDEIGAQQSNGEIQVFPDAGLLNLREAQENVEQELAGGDLFDFGKDIFTRALASINQRIAEIEQSRADLPDVDLESWGPQTEDAQVEIDPYYSQQAFIKSALDDVREEIAAYDPADEDFEKDLRALNINMEFSDQLIRAEDYFGKETGTYLYGKIDDYIKSKLEKPAKAQKAETEKTQDLFTDQHGNQFRIVLKGAGFGYEQKLVGDRIFKPTSVSAGTREGIVRHMKEWSASEYGSVFEGDAPAKTETKAETAPKPEENKLGGFLKNIAEIMGDKAYLDKVKAEEDPDSLKSAISDTPQFDENIYSQLKPNFDGAFEVFAAETSDIEQQMGLLIDAMTEGGMSLDTIEALEPYFVRFMEDKRENLLQKSENESKTESEVKNDDTDRNQFADNDQGSSAGKSAGSVQDADADGTTAPVSEDESGIGDGNDSTTPQRRNGRKPAQRKNADGTRSDADNAAESGDRNGDRTGDRLSNNQPESEDDGKIDYLAPQGSLTREGSWRETARRNLDIIELVKRLEAENRLATSEEQELLVKFTGWGASEIANNLFPSYQYSGEIKPEHAREGWKELAQRAKDIFTPEELKAAAKSTQNAHYTSEKIVRGIWSAFQQFGFRQGKVLEPGMGVGLFWSAAPESVQQTSRYTGIERETITARIAKHLLQRQAVLENDYVEQKLPDNFFDIAIGNPPFADTRILKDPRYKKYRFMLHDYFFAKTIDKVRPGGVLVFVTSKGTMDKLDKSTREYINGRADLLGAIRLPQTAFKENAGTEVVTDILFFRKRMDGEEAAGAAWLGLKEVTGKNKWGEDHTGLVNEYFVDHPEMVLGTHAFTGSMRHGQNEYTVEPNDTDIEQDFLTAVGNLPTNVFAEVAKSEEINSKAQERDWDPKAKKEGSIYVHDDGRLMRREFGAGVLLSAQERLSKNDEKWLRDYVSLRQALKQAQLDQLQESDAWEDSLKALNAAYDAFVKKHGRVTEFTTYERTKEDADGNEIKVPYRRYKNNRLLFMDVESPLVMALESVNEDGKIEKSAMLLKRTIKPPTEPEIRELSDALAVSLDQTGTLNLAHVAALMQELRPGMTAEEVARDLGDAVFETPTGEWQLVDEYLSGFVIDKLEEAQAAAASDKKFTRNVEALLKVQPKPLEPANINAVLGAQWVGANHVSEFAREIIGIGRDSVSYDPLTATWSVSGASGSGSRSNRGASNDWGTAHRSPQELLEAALNNQSIRITYRDSQTKKTIFDQEASALANEVVKRMRDAFRRWIWSDAARAQELAAIYNRKYNDIAPRFFDGSHLSTPGLSTRYTLHPHQKRAVWRVLQTGNTYLAHAVGAGKTLEMIVSAMEQKRLGLISKPMFVVPGHMLNQFASEFLDAYPMANVLIADKDDLAKEKRRRFVAKAALNDWDAIVIAHSSFQKIRTTRETSKAVIDDLVDQMRRAIAELDENDQREKRTIKELENRIEKIEQKFGAVASAEGKDDVINFEDLGVDFLYVDEAHEFRKLDFVTNRHNVKGIDSEGSQRALDLQIKLRWLNRQRPGRSAVLASGTPITNTLAELYTVMRYMDPEELESADIAHFDAWSLQFGEVASDYEMNAAGQYELVERYSRFINIPELMKRARKFMDVLTLRQLGDVIDLPTIKGGQAEIVVVPVSPEQDAYLKGELARRIKNSRDWKPSFQQPNNPDPLIAIIGDGVLAAIDMRFIDPTLPNDPNSKLNKMIDNIIENYHEYADEEYVNPKTGETDAIKGAAQIIFSYRGFGEGVIKNRGFDSKSWINKRLVEGGIPINEIVWMSDLDTAVKKENAFKEMRQGTKKILIGTPQNMGTGVNVQKRLKALHFLSPPWYPADVEQPDGRIYRQGNQNDEIIIKRYATKGTYDSTAWAMIARKSRAIEQAMSGDDSQRSIEDISESSQYEMASAVSAGDERAIRLVGLRRDIDRLYILKSAHESEQRQLSWDKKSAENEIDYQQRQIAKYDEALKILGTNYVYGGEYKVTVGASTFEKHGEIGEAIKGAWAKAHKANEKKAMALEKEKAKDDVIKVEIGKALGKLPLVVQIFSKDGAKSRLGVQIGEISTDLTGNNGFSARFDNIAEVDAVGLGTRLLNALNDVSKQKTQHEQTLTSTRRKLKQIESKIGQPFPDEQELYEKIAEHSQLQREMAGEGTSTGGITLDEFIGLLNEFKEAGARSSIDALFKNYVEKNPQFENQEIEPETFKSAISPEGAESQRAFYSQLERTIESKMPNRASASQIKGIVNNPQTGIKREEIEWLGINEVLDTKENFTKDEVLDFIRANNVEILETEKSIDKAEETGKESDLPKYSGYQLDGARENYKEFLLRLPVEMTPEQQELSAAEAEYMNLLRAKYGENFTNDDLNIIEQDALERLSRKLVELPLPERYTSSHFDEPNILAHIRFNERTDADGKRVLFIEEVQSDWGQSGRKKGFRAATEEKRRQNTLKAREERDAYRRELYEKYDIDPDSANPLRELREVWSPAESRRHDELHALQNPQIPDMPFKKSWHELAFKRMLRFAAENGFDKLAWTTGEQQNERYDLSKQVDKITYRKISDNEIYVAAHPKGATEPITETKKPSELDDFVGKEIADKIINGGNYGTLEGVDLKVGGAGMKGFYDKILPAFANKYVKKWNASVGTSEIVTEKQNYKIVPNIFGIHEVFNNSGYVQGFDSQEEAERFINNQNGDSTETVHSVDITPAMIDSISQGQPLFNKLGEDVAEDEAATVERMREMRYLPMDELLGGAPTEMIGGKLKVDEKGHERFRRLLEQIHIDEGKLKIGSDKPEDMFRAAMFLPKDVKASIVLLREKAAEAKRFGYTPGEIAVFERDAQMLEDAARIGNGTVIVYILPKALPEELFHQADVSGAMKKRDAALEPEEITAFLDNLLVPLDRHSKFHTAKLDAHPVTLVLTAKHFSRFNDYRRMGARLKAATIRAEIPPLLLELSDNELRAFGITPEQRDDYLLTWFEGYAEKNGVDALDNFEKDEINVQEFIRKIKESQPAENGGIRQKNEKDSPKQGQSNGETRGSPQGGEQSGRLSAGGKSTSVETPLPPGTSDDTRAALGDGQKYASLPATLRRAGIETEDLIYDVFGDRAATQSAYKMLQENGIEGSINLLKNTKDLDVDHAILSFMIQRVLLDNAARLQSTNPEEAENMRNRARELAREHATKAIEAGRFTRAASIISQSVEGVMYAVEKLVEERFGKDKTLSPEELARIEATARQAEEALAKVAALQKERNNLKRKIKRLEDERDGKRKKRKSKKGLSLRKALVEKVKEQRAAEIDKLREQLKARFAVQPDTLKSIIGQRGAANLGAGVMQNLEIAKKMREAGKDNKTVFLATGWELDADGHWKYDVVDAFTEFDMKALRESLKANAPIRLDIVLKTDKLFKAYPEFRNLKIVWLDPKEYKDRGGHYDKENQEIAILRDLPKLSRFGLFLAEKLGNRLPYGYEEVIVHEIQHAIQDIEGFPSGSLARFNPFFGWEEGDYGSNAGEVEARNASYRQNDMTLAERLKTPISETELLDEYSKKNAVDHKWWWHDERGADYIDPTEPDTLKNAVPGEDFDDETLDQFAEVGALLLTEGLARETDYLPDDFYAEMIAEFGDVIGANFQEIYMRAWQKRDQWLNEIRAENTKERIRTKYGEDLEDWEIEEILGEQKDKAKRRRAIENLHRLMSGAKHPRKNLGDLKRIISDIAPDDNAAIAAALLASGANDIEIYRELEAAGVTDKAKQREALRKGQEVFEKAKRELRVEQDAISNEILALQNAEQDIEDLRFAARQASKQAQEHVANELRRIKSGDAAYYASKIVDASNAMRTMMASFDLSGALRQGGFFSIAKPEAQAKAFAEMLKAFSEKNYGRAIMNIENHALFTQAQRMGIDFAVAGKFDDNYKQGEELFRGEEFIESIPGVGKILGKFVTKPSERTYTAFLDTQRMVMYDIFARELQAMGLTTARNANEFKKIADFINVATGRGTMPKGRAGQLLLDLPFFAPRYTLSRLQLLNMTLNPVAYANMPPGARKIVAKSAARFYGTVGAVMFLASMLGLVNWDDDDDDFLKIKIGNTKYDIFAGTLQPAKVIIKLVHSAIRTKGGTDNRLPGEFGWDAASAVGRYLRGKLSPGASFGVDYALDADYVGNEFKLSKAIISRVLPLIFSDAYEAYKLDGAVGVAKTLPSVLGIGTSTYKDRPERPETEAEKLAAKIVAWRLPNKPRTEEEKKQMELVADLKARSRQGQDVAAETDAALRAGKITKDQKGAILDARTETLLEAKAKSLSLEEFERVYKLASEKEKRILKPLLDKKMKSADIDGKLAPEDKKRLESLGGRVAGDFPMPEKVKAEFERFGIGVPDVGDSITVKKGDKRTLSPELYDRYRREALQKIYKEVERTIELEVYKTGDAAKKESLLKKAIARGRESERNETRIELRKN